YKVFDQNGCSRIEGSRGCAYSLCSYCGTVEKYNGPGWKPFDITFVLEELSSLSNIGFKSPWFTDEDFFGDNPKRVEEFAKVLIEYKKDGIINPNLDFYINARVDSVLGVDFGGKKESEKILTKLKKSGLREIFLGLESGCKNQLRRYRKFGIGQKNIEALNFLRGLGIETDIGFIFFDQSVSVSELRENLNFIYDAGINNHDARLIKRVRIEPRTPLGNDFSTKNQEVRIDLDSVEYEYEFDDPDVEEIFNTFRSWELGDLDVIYNLQAFCRGEIPEGYTRKEIKNIISKYRQLDCEYLNDILKVYENDKGETGKFIEEITNKYKTIRDTMDETLIDRVKWLDSTFRRNV
ncbi:MAG: hypothetical protein KJ613_05235, partial [Nanoarchaeota archaeon]|nr:hypothetical protein [Nanoarchaeota archaeon]